MQVKIDNIDDQFPYFPFNIERLDGSNQYLIKNHLIDDSLRLNRQAVEVLRLLNGEISLSEIMLQLAKGYPESGGLENIRAKIIPLLLLLTDKELIWWRDIPLKLVPVGPPPSIFWEITAACNLQCRHCVVSAGPKLAGELKTKRCLELAEEMTDFGLESVAFSGGEPFLHPDFAKIAERVRELGLTVQVATNGTLITSKEANWLKEIQAGVQVSLDGSNSKTHDYMRPGHNAFDRTIAGIKALVETGQDVTVGTVLSSINIDDINNIISLAQELGVAHFRLIPFVPKGRGEHYTHLEVPPKKVEKVTKHLYKLRNEVAISIADLEFEEMIGGNVCPEHLDLSQPLGCSGAVSYGTITPVGELLPCHFFEGVRADSIVNTSFGEVWRRSRFLNYFRHLNIGDLKGVCNNCSWLPKCGGSCRAVNFAKGDLFGPNLSCWIAEELKGDLDYER